MIPRLTTRDTRIGRRRRRSVCVDQRTASAAVMPAAGNLSASDHAMLIDAVYTKHDGVLCILLQDALARRWVCPISTEEIERRMLPLFVTESTQVEPDAA